MNNFLAADTEDNSKELLESGKSGFEKKVTQIACVDCDGNRYYFGGLVDKFLEWVKERPEKIIYFHNLQYDLGNLFGDNLDKIDVVLVGSRLIKARWNGKIFLDSFNIWPMALKKLGEKFDLQKLEMDLSTNDYVFRDCEIVMEAMRFANNFADKYNVTLPATLGGFAVKVFHALGLNNFQETISFAKDAFYGGRVELFHVGGNDTVQYVDINSLYPFCMCKEFPGELTESKKINGMFGIADVKIIVPEMYIAPLPVRREDGAIYYPIGEIRGWYTFEEIQYAVSVGCKIEKVYRAFNSKHGKKYYQPFVSQLYEMRKNSDSESEKLMLKLLMNNLYGQLAVNGVITRSIFTDWERMEDDSVIYGEKMLADVEMPLPDHCNYLHAAYVTSYARVELMKYLRKIHEEKLIYCDTDSVIFFGENVPFETGNELGQMKIVSVEKCAYTYAPKIYNVGKEYKAKGIPQKKAKEFIEKGWVEVEQPFKFREACAFFDNGNIRKLSVWRKFKKHFNTKYDKKELRGNQYFPLKIPVDNPGDSLILGL